MIHSMTGYAAVAVDTPRGRLGLELRSVNGRFLDLQFRIVEELRIHEPLLREMLSARLARGKVECRLQFAPGAAATQRATLNADALAELARLAADAKRAVPDAAPLRIADVLRWPGVMTEDAPSEAETRGRIEQLAAQALDELVAARAREGAKLAEAIRARVAEMRERVAEAAPLVPQAIAAYQEKIAQRLRDALGSADDDRVRAELALFGTRVDVDEELTRLGTHLDEVLRVLGERAPAGKRLDFLAQELNREANTLASKAASQGLADAALALKLLVEQMREQAQNIE
jgi:uncharacterized protein (TIGR00255 family)